MAPHSQDSMERAHLQTRPQTRIPHILIEPTFYGAHDFIVLQLGEVAEFTRIFRPFSEPSRCLLFIALFLEMSGIVKNDAIVNFP
jgi:hypothetical protein